MSWWKPSTSLLQVNLCVLCLTLKRDLRSKFTQIIEVYISWSGMMFEWETHTSAGINMFWVDLIFMSWHYYTLKVLTMLNVTWKTWWIFDMRKVTVSSSLHTDLMFSSLHRKWRVTLKSHAYIRKHLFRLRSIFYAHVEIISFIKKSRDLTDLSVWLIFFVFWILTLVVQKLQIENVHKIKLMPQSTLS